MISQMLQSPPSKLTYSSDFKEWQKDMLSYLQITCGDVGVDVGLKARRSYFLQIPKFEQDYSLEQLQRRKQREEIIAISRETEYRSKPSVCLGLIKASLSDEVLKDLSEDPLYLRITQVEIDPLWFWIYLEDCIGSLSLTRRRTLSKSPEVVPQTTTTTTQVTKTEGVNSDRISNDTEPFVLLFELFRMRQGVSEQPSSYIERFQKHWNKVLEFRQDIFQPSLRKKLGALVLLATSVPFRASPKNAHVAIHANQVKMRHVENMLLEKEVEQLPKVSKKQRKRERMKPTTTTTTGATAVENNVREQEYESEKTVKRVREDVKSCNLCGNTGHDEEHCPRIECQFCGLFGHTLPNCKLYLQVNENKSKE